MSEKEKYTLFGRIHPERGDVSSEKTRKMKYKSNTGEIEISTFLHGSQVIVEACPPEEMDVFTIRNHIRSAIASIIDPLAFLTGKHFDVEIIALAGPDEEKRVFGVEYGYLANRLSTEELSKKWWPRITKLYYTDYGIYLQHSFRDFKMALEHPIDTGFYCYRAVESLRQSIREEGDPDKHSWEKLRKIVDVDQDKLENNIKSYADPRRHGDTLYITAEQRKDALETTWDVLAGFVEQMSEDQ